MSNTEIKCRVDDCAHHQNSQDCDLRTVEVGTSNNQVRDKTCTECDSFEKRSAH
jgi:hypothetical protein